VGPASADPDPDIRETAIEIAAAAAAQNFFMAHALPLICCSPEYPHCVFTL
jgi:hypothetical protein